MAIKWLVMTLYLLSLINPVSKVSILSGLTSDRDAREFHHLTRKSSLAAAYILLGAMVFGHFLLKSVFRVELFSLRLAGGLVLFWAGFNALRKGVFFEQDLHDRFQDIAIVPLACPMIAGPATITACIGLPTEEQSLIIPIAAILTAIFVNHLIMRSSAVIAARLTRFNLLGAIIRLTGLIVMTMGTQMALDGIRMWVQVLRV